MLEKRQDLEFVDVFTPNLARPKHPRLWYLIYVLQIVSDDVCFLGFYHIKFESDENQTPKYGRSIRIKAISAMHTRVKPEEINPLNWRENLMPNLLSRRHGKALIIPTPQVLLHSDNIRHSHQLFRPESKETEGRSQENKLKNVKLYEV